MRPQMIGFAAFVLLVVIIGYLFGGLIITLVVNGVVLYLIGLRAFKQVNRGWLYEYGVGGLAALLIVWLAGPRVPLLWTVTQWLLLAFIIAQVLNYIKK